MMAIARIRRLSSASPNSHPWVPLTAYEGLCRIPMAGRDVKTIEASSDRLPGVERGLPVTTGILTGLPK